MSFTAGFSKVASVAQSLSNAGKQTVKEVLTLKGLRDSAGSLKRGYKGRYKDLLKTKSGLHDLGKAAIESAPSLAVAGAYGAAASKSYKAMKDANSNTYDHSYAY